MKKILAMLAICAMIAACGGGSTDPNAKECENPLYGGNGCTEQSDVPLIGPTGSEGAAS